MSTRVELEEEKEVKFRTQKLNQEEKGNSQNESKKIILAEVEEL